MALYVAGEILTATKLNRHLAVCQVHDATQTLTDETITTITFDSDEQVDTHGWHANGANPTRITPNIAGWYQFFGRFQLVTGAGTITRMQARCLVNGSLLYYRDANPVGATLLHPSEIVTPLISMNGTTDYFEFSVYMDDSGGTSRAVESWMTVSLVYPT